MGDEALEKYNELKKGKKLRYATFAIEDGSIVVKQVADKQGNDHQAFIDALPNDDPIYGVVDFTITTKTGAVVDKIIFVHWCPDHAPVKPKMLYASTKGVLTKCFEGHNKAVQASSKSDLSVEALTKLLQKV